MTHRFADIAFTDSVKAAQERYGSRAQNEHCRATSARMINSVREKQALLPSATHFTWLLSASRAGPMYNIGVAQLDS